jgi:hypothetical protein
MSNQQHVNPQNPYVFNENLFAGQAHFNFDSSSVAVIHHATSVLIPMLGISCAFMVSYLAIWQTPSQIRSFSKMILLCAVADVAFAISDLWCMVVSGF